MTLKTKPKKEKINIMGTKYKVEEPVDKTMNKHGKKVLQKQ